MSVPPPATRLYDEHVDAIYAYAARRVGAESAVDVVEEVFQHALRNADKRPSDQSDLAWLLALATAFLRRHSEVERRLLLDWVPQLRAGSGPLTRDPLLAEAVTDAGANTTRQVMAAVAELEPVERDLLFLVAWEGCSSSVAAAATNMPASAVRSRLGAIRKEIRRRIAATDAATDADDDAGIVGPEAANNTDIADPAAVADPVDEDGS